MGKEERALRFMRNLSLARAWNSWAGHHDLHRRARHALMQLVKRRVALAFNSWWVRVGGGAQGQPTLNFRPYPWAPEPRSRCP